MPVLDSPLVVALLLAWAPASCEPLPSSKPLPLAAECPGVPAAAKVPIRIVATRGAGNSANGAERGPSSGAAEAGLPLAPPGSRRGGSAEPSGPGSSRRALATVVSSLAVVLGIFALFAWAMRRGGSRRPAGMPGNVVATLGRCPLNARQEMQLVRVGNKLLLLSVTPTTAETLTEITDPAEIDRLTAACHSGHSDTLTESFRGMLHQLRTSPQPGYTFSAER